MCTIKETESVLKSYHMPVNMVQGVKPRHIKMGWASDRERVSVHDAFNWGGSEGGDMTRGKLGDQAIRALRHIQVRLDPSVSITPIFVASEVCAYSRTVLSD